MQNVPKISSETLLHWLGQNKPSALICCEENKVESLKTQLHSDKLLFVYKKESEHSFVLSFPLICDSYRCFFNLKKQNFTLENHHMMNMHQPFCWQITTTKMSNPLLPHPLTIWLLSGRGYGWLSVGNNFFPKPLELKIFSLTYDSVRLFLSIIILFVITHEKYFFQFRILFSQWLLVRDSYTKVNLLFIWDQVSSWNLYEISKCLEISGH